MAKKVTINIDRAIKYHNENNELRLTREGLFKMIRRPMNKQRLSHWKQGIVPDAFRVVYEVAEITGLDVNEIITVTDE